LLAAIISLILPHKFTATATILPPTSEQGGMLGFLTMNLPGDIAGLSRFMGGLPGLSSPSDLYAAIMQSSRIKNSIIRKYNLKKEFRVKTMHDASKALEQIARVSVSMEGIIAVSVTYKDKNLATEIANSFIEELDNFNTETAMTVGKRYRIFIEKRLRESTDSLALAEETLKNFQEKHRTVALDKELEAAIETIAQLKSQIILFEVQKGAWAAAGQVDNPYLANINRELRELKKQLTRIEFGGEGKGSKEYGAGFSVPFSKLPEISLEYARIYRDLKIQEVIYELLTQQYEQAKIMELKDTPSIQILDKASPPEKRSWPKRALIVIFAFLLSLFASIPLVFLLEYFDAVRNEPEEHQVAVHVFKTLSADFKALKSRISTFFRKKH
jgi:uncharacterized protein involved in exopolysaccharide biosynthesis